MNGGVAVGFGSSARGLSSIAEDDVPRLIQIKRKAAARRGP